MTTLYGEQTRLTLENMSFSGVRLAEFPSYLITLAQVKKACAIANHRVGLLDDEKKEAICQACDELLQHDYSEQFPVDAFHGGGGIGTNMNMNEVIASLAGHGVQSVDDVNMSQSTSDVCHTALRLCLNREAGSLVKVIGPLIRTAEEKSEAFHPIRQSQGPAGRMGCLFRQTRCFKDLQMPSRNSLSVWRIIRIPFARSIWDGQ